jgi:hypothetical protein
MFLTLDYFSALFRPVSSVSVCWLFGWIVGDHLNKNNRTRKVAQLHAAQNSLSHSFSKRIRELREVGNITRVWLVDRVRSRFSSCAALMVTAAAQMNKSIPWLRSHLGVGHPGGGEEIGGCFPGWPFGPARLGVLRMVGEAAATTTSLNKVLRLCPCRGGVCSGVTKKLVRSSSIGIIPLLLLVVTTTSWGWQLL